jgi:Sec-independent protein translocase protein TatA
VFNLSAVKLLIIASVVVIFLGPDKLPEAAHKVGRFWSGFRSWQRRLETEVREVIPTLPSTDALGKYVRNPSSLLDQLAEQSNNVPTETIEHSGTPEPRTRVHRPTEKPLDPGLN